MERWLNKDKTVLEEFKKFSTSLSEGMFFFLFLKSLILQNPLKTMPEIHVEKFIFRKTPTHFFVFVSPTLCVSLRTKKFTLVKLRKIGKISVAVIRPSTILV